MNPQTKEEISSTVLLLFSAFICFFSYGLSVGSITSPGPGFFPFYLGASLGLFALDTLTRTLVRKRRAADTPPPVRSDINWKNILFTVVVLFAYPVLLYTLGFALSTFLFMALFLRVISGERWPIVLGMGGAVAAVFYLMFQYWLQIQFPVGFFRL